MDSAGSSPWKQGSSPPWDAHHVSHGDHAQQRHHGHRSPSPHQLTPVPGPYLHPSSTFESTPSPHRLPHPPPPPMAVYSGPPTVHHPMAHHNTPLYAYESSNSRHQHPPVPYYVPSGNGHHHPHMSHPHAGGPQQPYPYPPFHRWPPLTPPPPPPVELIMTLQPHDVLSGRGGATNSYPGNRAFRVLVKQYQQKYLTAKKRDKPSVASEIVQVIRQRGGRFVRRCQEPYPRSSGNNGLLPVVWMDIGDDRAREKTCQALREGAPEMRRKFHGKEGQSEQLSPHEDDEKDSSSSKEDRSVATAPVCSSPLKRSTSKSPEDEPIVIRPCPRWMPDRDPVDPISLDELSTVERTLYLNDFYPPAEKTGPSDDASWSLVSA